MLYYSGGLRIRIRCQPEHPDPKSIEHRLFSHYLSSKFMIKYYQNMSISKTFFVGSCFTFFFSRVNSGYRSPPSGFRKIAYWSWKSRNWWMVSMPSPSSPKKWLMMADLAWWWCWWPGASLCPRPQEVPARSIF